MTKIQSSIPEAASPLHLPFLDGLRAFAALWVVLGHSHLFVLGWERSGSLWGRPLDLLLYSHLGVDLFLVLSGFCLALPVVRNANQLTGSTARYFKARAWRILPPYYAALLLLLLVNAFVPIAAWARHPVGLTADISWQVMATNLLLLQDVFSQFNSINGPFWSIATEWHLYFVFPALVWVLRRFGTRALLLCGGVAGFGLTWFSFAHPRLSEALPMSVPQPPYFIALFVMGAVSASYAFDPRYAASRQRLYRNGWLVGAGLCAPLFLLLWQYRIIDRVNMWGFNDHLHLIDPLTGAVAAAWLLGLCGLRPAHWLRRLLEGRALVWIGGFSYSLYLTHLPILAMLNHQLEDSGMSKDSPLAAFSLLALGGGALCLLFAWGFASLFERRYSAPKQAPAVPATLLREHG
jgi:peptidoglycan/LPS O-acetylase OafA/YrhL